MTGVKYYWEKAPLSCLKSQSPLKIAQEERSLKHAEPMVDEEDFREAVGRAVQRNGLPVNAQALKLMGLYQIPAQNLYMDRLVTRFLDRE